MTKREFELILDFLNVKKDNGEYRVNNYTISYVKIDEEAFAKITGKIALPLAEAIYKYHYVYPIFLEDDFFHKETLEEHARRNVSSDIIEKLKCSPEGIMEARNSIPVGDLYINNILIGSLDALRFIVELIMREAIK